MTGPIPSSASRLLAAAALILTASPLIGQTDPAGVEQDVPCRWNGGEDDSYCETREYRLDPRAELAVDAGVNGGIEVTGWDREEVRLIARVGARSRDGDSRALASEIRIRTGGTIEAIGPDLRGSRDGWSVSFELMVPRQTALHLRATNGGIRMAGLSSRVDARTTNGGIRVVGGAGEVRGVTTNGGLHVELTGARWAGTGLDLQTTNGGIEIVVPRDYSAELETGTVNGSMRLDVPIMVQGRIDRRLRTTLGSGGPTIRVVTTNGGVVLRQ